MNLYKPWQPAGTEPRNEAEAQGAQTAHTGKTPWQRKSVNSLPNIHGNWLMHHLASTSLGAGGITGSKCDASGEITH